jgi:hypothetical protein
MYEHAQMSISMLRTELPSLLQRLHRLLCERELRKVLQMR